RVTAGSGRAAAGVPVSFVLNPPDRNENKVAGSFGRGLINTPTYTATTNADGIVSVPFSAGEAAGSVTIVATVRGEPPQRAAVVTSSNGANGFWNAKTAAPVFLTAAAIIGAGVAVAVSREGKVPIKGIGPLTIVPSRKSESPASNHPSAGNCPAGSVDQAPSFGAAGFQRRRLRIVDIAHANQICCSDHSAFPDPDVDRERGGRQ